jgi:hypothetical protein
LREANGYINLLKPTSKSIPGHRRRDEAQRLSAEFYTRAGPMR